MGSPTTIHPFPGLEALAEEEARDIWTRHVRLFRERLPDMEVVADPHDASDGFAVTVDAQVERLCDLTRPASRDAVARLVAKRIGWNVSDVTAAIDWNWNLYVALHRTACMTDPDRWEPHPPPAEALALIVRHLWPKEAPHG